MSAVLTVGFQLDQSDSEFVAYLPRSPSPRGPSRERQLASLRPQYRGVERESRCSRLSSDSDSGLTRNDSTNENVRGGQHDAPENSTSGEYLLTTVIAPKGDMNLDGNVDMEDINGFVMALANPAHYEATHSLSPSCKGIWTVTVIWTSTTLTTSWQSSPAAHLPAAQLPMT